MLASLETWELLSYVVTVVGLPLALALFIYEQRKERDNEEAEVFQLLSDNYQEFLKVVIDNPDLRLFTKEKTSNLSEEQRERMVVIFEMLISLFERAYILVYEESMNPDQRRRWAAWEDYISEWCEREDFRALLPDLLRGEDPEFVTHMERIAARISNGPVC
jgi:AcrR family transcriptional regulator